MLTVTNCPLPIHFCRDRHPSSQNPFAGFSSQGFVPSGQNLYLSISRKVGSSMPTLAQQAECLRAKACSLFQSRHILILPIPALGCAACVSLCRRPVYIGVSSALHMTLSRSTFKQCKTCKCGQGCGRSSYAWLTDSRRMRWKSGLT